MNKCLFCGNTDFNKSLYENTLFNKKEYEYLTCNKCKLVQVTPLPDSEDFDVMYSGNYFSNYISYQPSKEYEYIFSKINKEKTIFLDYGCGCGRILVNAIEKGMDVTGVDYTEELIGFLKKAYPSGQFYTVDEFWKTDTTFDVIFLSNVFEHLVSPVEISKMLKNKLNKGGILIAEGPIEDNFTIAGTIRKILFGSRKYLLGNKTHHAPRHIFYSNYNNQLKFFSDLNLRTLVYKVAETHWPFPAEWASTLSLKEKCFFVIASISTFLGKFIPKNGNTFFYVGEKIE